jgi:uncharacterized Zn finger protein
MRYADRSPYVSAAQRREKAARALDRLHRQGLDLQPVILEGRAIAHTFWGRAWCENLESYSDYENRLPRGRSYLRGGSVCHLEIQRGRVRARVSGTRLYEVSINIRPLSAAAWRTLLERCSGRIASALDLLQGSLSEEVMKIVTDRQGGLFPAPRDIEMRCSCPDWAFMCKHIAAALYGVGARLDSSPEVLFLLRGVDHTELIEAKAQAVVQAVLKGGKRPRLKESDIEEIFGLELERPAPEPARPQPAAQPAAPGTSLPERITGSDVRALRERLGLTPEGFARYLKVSQATLSAWERAPSALRLQARTRDALQRAWRRAARSRGADHIS